MPKNPAESYVNAPHQFYKHLFDESGLDAPGPELANLLSLSPAHVNKFGRVRESDEEPNGSGKRSDLERLIFTIKYFAAKYHLLHICQKLIFDIQQEIDEELARKAASTKLTSESFNEIKERALQDLSALTVAIGAGKSPEEISRLLANHLISTKRLIAVTKQQK